MRVGLNLRAVLLALASFLGACAADRGDRGDRPDPVDTELQRLAVQAQAGVEKIQRGLADPGLASSELGEGVWTVDAATRMMGAIEADERATDVQQLLAIVEQARAWDDVARSLQAVPSLVLDERQRSLVQSVLGDKVLPAQAQAVSGFQRARERACRAGLEQLPVMLEILDGLSRHGEGNISLDRPCNGQ